MKSLVLAALAALVSLAAVDARGQQRPAETDSLGRVVRDAQGARKNYARRSDGRNAKLVAPAARGTKSAAAARPVLRKAGAVRASAIGLATTYAESWRFNTWGYGIGYGGFWPVDVDADGDQEFIYGLGFGQWAIADYEPSTQDYFVKWKSPQMAVTALRVVEVGNTKTVWIAGNSDGVRVYNALTQERIATLPLPQNVSITALEFGDGNNDGTPDVIGLATNQLLFFDASTMQAEPSVSLGDQASVSSFALGNVDDDADLEIALSDGRVICITGDTPAVEWNRGTAFGYQLRLADIDGDNRDELVASQGWYSVQAWNLELQASKWEYPADLDVAAVRAFDVTGDGVPEVIVGDGQWGAIHVLDGNSGAQLWEAPNPEHGVTDIGVSDPDGDGALELMWGAGATPSGPDYMYVVNVANRAVEYQSFDIANYFSAVDVGDVDNDGRAELVVASYDSDSGYADGVMLIFDAITHKLEFQGPTNMFNNTAWTGVHALRIANVDGDPQPEILVATDKLYDGRLFVIDGVSRTVEHEWPFDSGSPLQTLDVADLDGDGLLDVLAGNSVAHSGSPGTFLYAINPRTGATIWKSQSLGYYPSTVIAADVGAPGLDLVVGMGPVLRVRWSDKQQTQSVGTEYASVLPLDVTGGAELEIVAGKYDGSIDVLDGETLEVLSNHPSACSIGSATYSVTALVAHGPSQVAFACNTELRVYDLATSTLITSVDTENTYFGINGSLRRFTAQGKSSFLSGGLYPAVFTDIGGNSVPSLNPLSASLHWRGSTDLQVIGSDDNGDTLTYQLARLPALGTVTMTDAATGQLHYTANGTGKGADSLQVRAYDGFQFSDLLTVAITLTNTAPTTTTTAIEAHWRGAQTLQLAGSDPDGDPLSFALGTLPTHGTLTVADAAAGDILFTPTGAFVGADSFTFTASDGADVSAARTVQLNLTNTVPTAPNASYSVVVGSTTSARVMGSDADDDPLTYAVSTPPSRGTLTLDAATGLFDYVPSAGNGAVTAQVVVRDGVSESSPVTLTFNYASSGSSSGSGGGGKKGGGGSFDLLILLLLAGGLLYRIRFARR
ncbi:MAG TPA: Ig-like domain-containing protein [Steroidobacteraceae bacterium]|nr:Ig-like domain-containing protein [Steroidobacteraceae bacterium]